MQTIDTLYCLS